MNATDAETLRLTIRERDDLILRLSVCQGAAVVREQRVAKLEAALRKITKQVYQGKSNAIAHLALESVPETEGKHG